MYHSVLISNGINELEQKFIFIFFLSQRTVFAFNVLQQLNKTIFPLNCIILFSVVQQGKHHLLLDGPQTDICRGLVW